MITLLDYFLRLIRLKAAPQDLPVSQVLLLILVVLAVLVGTINGIEFLGGLQSSLLLNILDTGLTLALLAVTLQINGKSSRFMQTATAYFGVSVLLVLVIFVLNQAILAAQANALGSLLLLVVSIWSQVVYGHILRHALEIRLSTGIIIALGYSVVSFMIVSQFFTTV